jgi:hypothetical protein
MHVGDGAAAVLDLTMPSGSDLAGRDLASSPSSDMGMSCHPSGGCPMNGVACAGATGGCCGQGEQCIGGNTCMCGSNPPCTGGMVCSSGVAMKNGCGITCCKPPGCP